MCSLSCQDELISCGGKCVDPQSNLTFCGATGKCTGAAAGKTCGAGQVCNAGKCSLSCQDGLINCGDTCIDPQTSATFCGATGTCEGAAAGDTCDAGFFCDGGECSLSCQEGLAACDGACVNLNTDHANCGTCGKQCAGAENCIEGDCIECDSTTTDCDGDGWMVSDGDCCDKVGLCGNEPEKVNPGAIEVVGNSIDDNCNTLIDLFDTEDTIACDAGLASNSKDPNDFAKALGICRTTEEAPENASDKTWGLIEAKLVRADGTELGDGNAASIRTGFGGVSPGKIEGDSMIVLSSGIAADATQTEPGPNGGAPAGGNVSTTHAPSSQVDITTCEDDRCIKDWFAASSLPVKSANALPAAPDCGSGTAGSPHLARDSVMLVLRLRAPTNAKAFSFSSYFLSAEYPEFVCSSFNDQFVTLVSTPDGEPAVPNPTDKNLMVYTDGTQQFPIGINVAAGTDLFSVCDSQEDNAGCWDSDISPSSCALGNEQLAGTGFEGADGQCTIGGGTFWLTTSGNVVPGGIVELRIALWDVGDTLYDSTALIDGFEWLPDATVPGTGN